MLPVEFKKKRRVALLIQMVKGPHRNKRNVMIIMFLITVAYVYVITVIHFIHVSCNIPSLIYCYVCLFVGAIFVCFVIFLPILNISLSSGL